MNFKPQNHAPDTTGLPAKLLAHEGQNLAVIQPPLAHAWITDHLIKETQQVWSEHLGRSVPEEEAIEMLINLRRLAEALAQADQSTDRRPTA
jgi:hypothetical protein